MDLLGVGHGSVDLAWRAFKMSCSLLGGYMGLCKDRKISIVAIG
jgi:hypothetical protein